MTEHDFRLQAEEHWEFLEGLLKAYTVFIHCLYVESMVHGYKHGREFEQKEVLKRLTTRLPRVAGDNTYIKAKKK
jgi:hypothetical protein